MENFVENISIFSKKKHLLNEKKTVRGKSQNKREDYSKILFSPRAKKKGLKGQKRKVWKIDIKSSENSEL